MTCDFCGRQINYCFYINDYHWLKVVGEERFDKNQGIVCAHCALERLGGLDWYITWNEASEKARLNAKSNDRDARCGAPDQGKSLEATGEN